MTNVKKFGTASAILLGGMMLSAPQEAFAARGVPSTTEVIQQQKTVTGTVVDEKGEPIIGASVFEDGTRNGTVTDVSGHFTLKVKPGATLTVSYIGYGDKMVAVDGKNDLKISMSAEDNELNEVVVTALGIKREKKALGYALQEVNTAGLTENKTTSVANMLQGKVAGVQITQSGTGLGGSTRIVMRGLNSLGGNNQPLWVVDGIPVNDESAQTATQWGGTDSYGSASQINPEDIATISVLKGANAAALYGSRAQNGAIIVTTKSGSYGQPLTFEYNGNVEFTSIYNSYKYQNVYGQGSNGQFDVRASGSWGPKMEGQEVANWRNVLYGDPNNRTYKMLPQKDFIEEFYNTGSQINNSIIASAGGKNARTRLSFTDSRNKGVTPNHKLDRQYFGVNSEMNNDWISVGIKGTYMHEVTRNAPGMGEYGIMQRFVQMPRSIRLQDLDHDFIINNRSINWAGPSNANSNPYSQIMRENGNESVRDRLMGQASATLTFTDYLKLTGRVSLDMYNDKYRKYVKYLDDGSNDATQYVQSRNTTKEFNSDLILSFNKGFGDYDVNANLGTSLYNISHDGLAGNAGLLQIPLFIYMGNGQKREASESYSKKEIQSVFFSGSLGYKSMLYLDVTGRNDWSSTLPKSNRSYFYPSVSLSGIISQMVKLPEQIDYMKLRASWAQVGNDTDPYQIAYTYATRASNVNSLLEMQLPSSYPLLDLKPEKTDSWELGLEYRMLKNRLGIDFTYYNTKTHNQILSIGTAASSGYTARMVNAGEISSHGIELMINGTPLLNKDWRWDVNLNWGSNRTKCVRLTDQIKRYTLGETRVASVVVNEGSQFGDIVAKNAYKRDNKGNVLVGNDGLPLKETDKVIGNMMPKWTGSVGNTVTYKDFSFTALVDMLYGGDFISMTDAYASTAGNSKRSLDGRDGMVFNGLVEATGQPNTTSVKAEAFYNSIGGSSAVAEEFMYKRTYVKMAELAFGWTLPKQWLTKTPLQAVKLSLVGRDLFYFFKNAPVGAESSFSREDYAQAFEYASLPPTRAIGFSVNVKF